MTSRISGAKPEEVSVMGGLTANLQLMLSQFYNPTSERYKFFCDANAFPSDQVSGHHRTKNLGVAGGHSPVYASLLSLHKSRTMVSIPRTPSSRSRRGKASFGSGKKTYWTLLRKKAQRSPLFSSAPSHISQHNGTR